MKRRRQKTKALCHNLRVLMKLLGSATRTIINEKNNINNKN